ncbi:DUF262 domain protein [Campylobacter vicugnae]|uniref:DUF262 domain protein n=1 Tax=Campylobacter vicugnae TaxID=1660076 RepID=A0A1X9SZZ8_9BACT|nr:DUF262 domain-containing protein [Campylobacter sp. RM8964]ARR01854.1 DUF262 domain protein [Campylobacter sp. RM8964]
MNEVKTFEGEESLNLQAENYKKDLRISKERISIFEINRKLDNPERGLIELNPDFQRDDDRWNEKQKSELIESILLGIPLPVFYLFQTSNGKRQVVDGRQRLHAIRQFYKGELKLSKLTILSELNGKKFSDLEPVLQNSFEDYQLEIYALLPPTNEDIKFNLFDRLNRGGTQLNHQEMRNALYQGASTKLIKDLSCDENFKLATKLTEEAVKSMKDRYLILRFIVFYLIRQKKIETKIEGSIDDILANAMKEINEKAEKLNLAELEYKFKIAIENIVQNGADKLFRFTQKDRKRPLNMILFESVVYLFVLAQEKGKVVDIQKLEKFKDDEFDKPERITYGIDSAENINFRFSSMERLLDD